jgi:hypothetical protein
MPDGPTGYRADDKGKPRFVVIVGVTASDASIHESTVVRIIEAVADPIAQAK